METENKTRGSRVDTVARFARDAFAGLGIVYLTQLAGVVDFGVQIIQPPTVEQLVDQAASYYPPAKKK